MARPIPPELGYPVSTSQYNWLSMCVEAWGDDWNKPDIAYEWPNDRKFDSSDKSTSGVYRRS